MASTSLKNGLIGYFNEIGASDEVAKKAYRTAQVHNLYKDAIKHVYGDSAFLVLEKTNGVYIMNQKDKGLRRKVLPEDKTIKRMLIYTCDSMVHADLDSKQEFIKMWLAEHGETIDKFDLLTSKMGMRKTFPFENDVKDMKKVLSSKFTFLQDVQEHKESLTKEQLDKINIEIEKIDNEQLKQAIKATVNSLNI